MADAIARKYVEIVADGEKALALLSSIDKQATKATKSVGFISKAFKQFGYAIQGFVGYQLAGGLRDFADSTLELTTRLQGATGSVKAGAAVFEDLLTIGNRLGIGVDTLAASYAKLKVSIPTAESEEVVRALDAVGQILSTTGAQTQQVNAVMLQLSQALASGALQGDEFRSIYENAPVLLRAWQEAAGLTGTSLRELSATAQLTTESFFSNLEAIKEIATEMTGLAEPPLTIGRAFTRLKNNARDLFILFESNVPVTAALASVISLLAENLDALAFALLAASAGFAAMNLQSYVAAAGGAAAATKALAGSMAGLGVATGTAATVLRAFGAAAAAFAGYKLGKFFSDAAENQREMREELTRMQPLITRLGDIEFALFEETDISTLQRFKNSLIDVIPALEFATQTAADNFNTVEEGSAAYGVLAGNLLKAQTQLAEAKTALAGVNDTLRDARQTATETGDQYNRLNKQLEDLKGKVDQARQSLKVYTREGEDGVEMLEDAYRVSKSFTDALAKQKTTLEDATAAQVAYAEETAAATSQILALTGALERQREAQAQVNEVNQIGVKAGAGAVKLGYELDPGDVRSAMRDIRNDLQEGDMDKAKTGLDNVKDALGELYDQAETDLDRYSLDSLRTALADLTKDVFGGEEEDTTKKLEEEIALLQQAADQNAITLSVEMKENFEAALKEKLDALQQELNGAPLKISIEADVEVTLDEAATEEGGRE